jgi:tripartite-type tricarboxylate transporter receptor subunit TctC
MARAAWRSVSVMRRLLLVLLLPMTAHAASAGSREVYPSRPIRLVVPFSTGGAADVPARLLSQKLSEALGQQIVVDNRPGAASTIGADLVAKARPDGYTLLAITTSHFVSAGLYVKLPYRPLEDFAPVTAFATAPYVLAVHPALEAKTVKTLIGLAKAAPGKIDYASSGNGSLQHLSGALFQRMTGIELTHIPYKGSASALTDLLSGRIKVTFAGMVNLLPHTRSGRLWALGVSSSKRSVLLPDVPTIAEAGVAGYDAMQWTGIAAPQGTPREIITQLHAGIVAQVLRPDFAESLLSGGSEVFYHSSPEQGAAFMKQESIKWPLLVKDSGARIN